MALCLMYSFQCILFKKKYCYLKRILQHHLKVYNIITFIDSDLLCLKKKKKTLRIFGILKMIVATLVSFH